MSRVLLVLLLALPARVGAHGRSVSYSTWALGSGGAHVELRLAALDATLTGLDPWRDADALARHAAERLVAFTGARPCTVASLHGALPVDGSVVVTWDVACDGAPDAIVSRLFAETAPSHLHFARVTTPGGAVTERVLTADDARWTLARAAAPTPDRGSSLLDYVRLGVDHIRTGYDHLAFVLALLLLAASLGEVATIVSAFTVAHSVTLAAAVLGVVHPVQTAVEALIGFSIALVAFENAWLLGGRDRATRWVPSALLVASAVALPGAIAPATLLGLALFAACHLALLERSTSPARLRAVIAFGFGLVHGFGFAGVLAELDLPSTRLVPALLGFNVGVEVGQLAVVTAGWLALAAIERVAPGGRRRVAEVGSAVVCGLGLFWFVTRGWG
jgi:hypothetical protein